MADMLVDLRDQAVESVRGRGVDLLRLICGRKGTPRVRVQDILNNRVDDTAIGRNRGGDVCLSRDYRRRGKTYRLALPLVRQQEERLVLDNRPAQRSTKLVVPKCVLRIGLRVEEIARVKRVVAEVLKNRAMEAICSRF